MIPTERATHRPPREAVVFPFVDQNFARRGQKWIVSELIDANFRQHNRNGDDVAKPQRVGVIHQIDQNGVDCPCRNGENQVSKILRTWFSFLEKKDQEELGQNRTGQNSSDDDEGESVLLLVMRQSIKPVREGRTQIIRDQNQQHGALENKCRDRIGPGRFPTKRERRA